MIRKSSLSAVFFLKKKSLKTNKKFSREIQHSGYVDEIKSGIKN